MKLVSIIILNYNLTDNVRNLLKSINKYTRDINYEVIVVDNNSPDRSIESLPTEFPQFRFEFLKTNYGFGHGNNVGASLATGKYLLLLNPDTYLVDNLPLKLYEFAEKHKDFGIIGPQMQYPDGSFQISYAKFPNIKQEIAKALGIIKLSLTILHRVKCKVNKEDYFDVDFVFGSCMFIRKEVFESVNGFDEKYFLLSEETDLCYEVKKYTGSRIIYWRSAKIIHLKSQITGKDKSGRFKQEYISKFRFFSKHYSLIYFLIIRIIIVFIFVFKYLASLIKKGRKGNAKKIYLFIIQLYLNSSSRTPDSYH